MTAKQIIDEIAVLPPDEQAKVVLFAYHLDAERQLTGKELSSLAERMVATTGSRTWPRANGSNVFLA